MLFFLLPRKWLINVGLLILSLLLLLVLFVMFGDNRAIMLILGPILGLLALSVLIYSIVKIIAVFRNKD